MTEPRTPGHDETPGVAPRPEDPPQAWVPQAWVPQPPSPDPTATQPVAVPPGAGPQPWYGRAGAAQPGPWPVDPAAVPPMPLMTPDAERTVPLLGRLPGAVVAAAAAGLLVIGVAGGFGVARATDSTATTTAASTTQLGTGTGTTQGGTGTTPGPGTVPGGTGGRQGGGTVGTIASLDGASFTVQTPAGEEVAVSTDADTRVEAEAGSTVSALAVGDVVMVRGTAAADGTVTATLVVQGELRGGGGAATDPGTTAAPTTTTEGTTT